MTALRAVTAGRVAVDLDGEPWRTLPLEAVVRAGLAAGRPLERAQARTLARELRRLDALRVATGALRFYASVRLDIRRIETLKEGVEAIGNRVRVKVVKNKVAPPFK
ncbi:MAG TPA: hypothetical protein VM204_06605, partial [Gaiellaceae bacterium]|nr:hypothetical protein [Gaiellaceae bacterium]